MSRSGAGRPAARRALPSATPSNAELARRAIDALGRGDTEAFVELLEPDIEIQTAKGIRHGLEDAAVWARQEYDHLVRRYEIDELIERGDLMLVLAHVQYVWRESGEVGDSSPVAILLAFREGKLSRWHVYESWEEGRAALGE